MRYYGIKISGAPASFPARYDGGCQWGTEHNGKYDVNAQDIEMHLEIFNASPDPESEMSTVTIYGVSWQQIRDSVGLIDRIIEISGGMRPGLPLATYQSRHKGLLLRGRIQKAWGNWVGTEMSLSMAISVAGDPNATSSNGGGGAQGAFQAVSSLIGGGNGGSAPAAARTMRDAKGGYKRVGSRLIDRLPLNRGPSVGAFDVGGDSGFDTSGFGVDPSGGQLANYIGGGFAGLTRPLNLIHNLLPNMPLSSAIQETLNRALPGVPVNMAIHPSLKLGYQDAGMYQSLQQYAGFIKNLSNSIMGSKNYGGVRMTSNGTGIDVWDGTTSLGTGDVTALDLIGQPVWVNRYQVSVKVVMRADLKPGMDFTIPPNTLMTLGPGAIQIGTSEQRTNISIPGTFKIDKVLHIGAFRNPDGNNWCTIYEATGGLEGGTAEDNPAADAQHATEINQQQNPTGGPVGTDAPGTGAAPSGNPPSQSTPQSTFGSVFRRAGSRRF